PGLRRKYGGLFLSLALVDRLLRPGAAYGFLSCADGPQQGAGLIELCPKAAHLAVRRTGELQTMQRLFGNQSASSDPSLIFEINVSTAQAARRSPAIRARVQCSDASLSRTHQLVSFPKET